MIRDLLDIESFLAEANNNVIQLRDQSQTATTQYSYEAYGNTTTMSLIGTSGNSQQYTGRENDGTGLYFYWARYYRPDLGRFVQSDPIGQAGGTNSYAYVEGRPVILTDPMGELGVPGAIAGGISAASAVDWVQRRQVGVFGVGRCLALQAGR